MALSWRNLPYALKAAIIRKSGPWRILATLRAAIVNFGDRRRCFARADTLILKNKKLKSAGFVRLMGALTPTLWTSGSRGAPRTTRVSRAPFKGGCCRSVA